GLLVKKQVVYFAAEALTREIKLSWEHQEAKWLDFEAALALLKYDNARTLLYKAHTLLGRNSSDTAR
ncbi:MAG: hypothetical protein LC737_01770, partial [Chloroflexi bacterium]|nr:hypothetical protein [Chloroflexota bacterium]